MIELLALAVLGAALYFVIRNRWYVHAVLILGFAGSIGCSIGGIFFLNDSKDPNDTAGAVLLVGGIALLLGCGVATWFFLKSRRST